MQPRPTIAFCPSCRSPKNPNEVTCGKCGARSCPNGHPLVSKICSSCGWQDRNWRPQAKVPTFDATIQRSQGIPEVREGICPRCQVKSVFTLGRCVNCGFMVETGQTAGTQQDTRPAKPKIGAIRQAPQNYVVQQQYPGAHDSKLAYACPRCGVKADPRAGSCQNCGFIGSMEYAMPQQQTSDGFTPPSPRASQNYASQQFLPPRNEQPGHACPFCGASVPSDSKFCQQCGQLSGSGRQYERYTPASELANRGAPIQMSRMIPSIEAASPGGMVQDFMGTYIPPQDFADFAGAYTPQQDQPGAYAMPQPGSIPGIGAEFPEYQAKPRPKKREKAYPRKAQGFPVGLLVAIFVVAAALISMVIFVVSQVVATPPKPTIATIDKTPPVISGLSVSSVSGSSVIIEWTTDEKATSQLRLCDPNGVCTWTEPDATLVKNHSSQVNDIKLGIKYHVTVSSIDAAGNEGTKETDQVFTTTVQPPTPPTPPPPPDNIPEGIGLGQRAPNFILKNLQGADVSLNSLKGKLVMINFWRVDCPPCIAEMPHIQSVFTSWAGAKQLVVLAIYIPLPAESAASAQSTAQSYIDASKYSFPVLLDSLREVKTTFNVTSWPRTFFLDSNGVIKKIQIDAGFASPDEIKAILNSL